MVQIPDNTVTQHDIEVWYDMQQKLAALKASEMLLRTKIFRGLFTEPKEGVNTHDLSDGWVLKGTYVITREIDLTALSAYREEFAAQGIVSDELVNYKPSLSVSSYKTLTEEQKKLFDNALIIKPGSPSMKIELPAAAKKVTPT